MEAIQALPKVLNAMTGRLVPRGVVKLFPDDYYGTSPIYIYDDWQVVIDGQMGLPSNLSTNGGAKYICSSPNGVIAIVPGPYSFTQTGGFGTEGLLYIKNVTFVSTSLISEGIPSSFTNQAPPASGLYYPVNFGVQYTNNSSQQNYATTMSLILDNVSISSPGIGNAGMNIQTNTYEEIIQLRGDFIINSASAYHNPVVRVNSFHFIAEVMDLTGGFSGNNNTDYATLEISPGMRPYIATLHIGGRTVCPLYVDTGSTMTGLYIGVLALELSAPPIQSSGYYYGSAYPSNVNMAVNSPLFVGVLTGNWNPLSPGTVINFNGGCYLKIGKVLASNGAPDPVQYPWGNASLPTGITNYSNILQTKVGGTAGYNKLATSVIFYDHPYLKFQNLSAQSVTSTTPVNLVLDSETGITSYGYNPKTTFHIVVRAKLTVSNSTVGDSVTVGIYNGSTLLTSETYTQEGLASNPHDMELIYVFNQSDATGLSGNGTLLTFTLQANVSGGTGSVIVKEFAIDEV
ncbi:MAG: hypothetical protein QW752_06920 [Thermoplasmata archaeon]